MVGNVVFCSSELHEYKEENLGVCPCKADSEEKPCLAFILIKDRNNSSRKSGNCEGESLMNWGESERNSYTNVRDNV